MLIGLDGPGVTPETVDPQSLLGLATSYLAAIRAVARRQMAEVSFSGLLPLPGRAGVKVFVEDEEPVHESALVIGLELASPRSREPRHLRTLSAALARLPPEQRARVHLTQLDWDAPLAPFAHELQQTFNERTTRRVRVIDSGGERNHRVRVLDYQTGRRFTLHASRDETIRAGSLLYRDIDAHMLVSRDVETLRIRGGRLLGAEPVGDMGGVEEIRTWWKSSFEGRDA